ncbi:MAG: DoxX family protein [Deltaproteobacteria bacterium]|nr:MAG: DoxX family protein [Deltaproteobacteria bacterium]
MFKTKLINLFKPVALPCSASAALLVLRLITGVAFMIHGWGKIQTPFSWMPPEAPIPAFLQFLAALSEFGGGLALILGLLTPLASFGIFCTMSFAVNMHMVVMKHPFVSTAPGGMSYEPALVYWGISLLLLLTGAGKFSLDRKIFGER